MIYIYIHALFLFKYLYLGIHSLYEGIFRKVSGNHHPDQPSDRSINPSNSLAHSERDRDDESERLEVFNTQVKMGSWNVFNLSQPFGCGKEHNELNQPQKTLGG